MTDYSNLVKELRATSDDWPACLVVLDTKAADALEAQAKRIKELAARVYEQHIAIRAGDEHEKLLVAEKDARIAELEAALNKAEETLTIASRQLSDDHKLVLNGKKWGQTTLETIRAALEKSDGN